MPPKLHNKLKEAILADKQQLVKERQEFVNEQTGRSGRKITITVEKLHEVLTVMLHDRLKDETQSATWTQAENIIVALEDMANSGDNEGVITLD